LKHGSEGTRQVEGLHLKNSEVHPQPASSEPSSQLRVPSQRLLPSTQSPSETQANTFLLPLHGTCAPSSRLKAWEAECDVQTATNRQTTVLIVAKMRAWRVTWSSWERSPPTACPACREYL
jgi:hypothetical protein